MFAIKTNKPFKGIKIAVMHFFVLSVFCSIMHVTFPEYLRHVEETAVTFTYGRSWWSSREAVKLVCTFSLVPLAPVESARSLPARSTRLILLTWNQTAEILLDWSTHTKIRHKGNLFSMAYYECGSLLFPITLLAIESYTVGISDIMIHSDDSIKPIQKALV